MKELYSIMRDLLEVEYNQKSLLYILKLLEKDCSGDQKEEMRLIVNCAKYYLEAVQMDMKKSINRMDNYIARTARKK